MIAAVIGAAFGDEGKGAVVDFLSTTDTLVVRQNGGAQAGHTVVTPDGRRHEFHHFGAGSFRGCPTLLSRFFIVNPMVFAEEWDELAALGVRPEVLVDHRAQVSTPWDALLNQAVERKRGKSCHGSCGVGINETVTRAEAGYGLTYGQCAGATWRQLEAWLRPIVRDYVPRRAAVLGVEVPQVDEVDYVTRFVGQVEAMTRRADSVSGPIEMADGDLVFEGAQGLRLDEIYGTFPHVTRSRTGLTNVEVLLHEAGRYAERVDAYYVTRTYVTRHGPGPLPFELPAHPWGWAGPETNVENPWQGRLRYAPLSPAFLYEAVTRDLAGCRLPSVYPSYAVTCVDQISADFDDEGRVGLLRGWFRDHGIPVGLVASGPTREDVARWSLERKEMVG